MLQQEKQAMELKEFISQTLLQIIEGIKQVQEADTGTNMILNLM